MKAKAVRTRQKYPTRPFLVRTEDQRERVIATARNMPLDQDYPVEVVFREPQKQRTPTQNERMWAGPLRDIAEQAYVEGSTFSAEVWHEHFKEQYLPEEYDEELCREGYRKWDYSPSGKRILVGSTTQLTTKGFADYMEQVYAFGASLGVMFTAAPGDGR